VREGEAITMRSFRWRRQVGLRWRISIAFIAGALALSALVAGTTYLLAHRYLYNQRVEDSMRQTISNVRSAVVSLSQLDEDVSLPLLGRVLETRGAFESLLVEDRRFFSSSFSISPSSVPTELAEVVGQGRVGYSFRSGEPRYLVFGSPVPGHGLHAYFFYPLGDLDQTLAVLQQVLLGVALGAVVLAAAVGARASRRLVGPLRRASEAARRVADGLLETRLTVEGRDELAALARSFNEMAAALEERIARERRFVGDVSHELRTPLTTLRASTDYLLQTERELPPSLRRAVELLSADVDYLRHLVDDLLEISRVEAGRVQMSWERLNVADLIREVAARRRRAGGDDIAIIVEGDPQTLSTVADKQRLERVVANLVDNAVVHGEGRDVSVHVGAEDGFLLVSVHDHGPGIPPSVASRIFERFFKADPARHRGDGRGSGLGLAIARENAHLHGGEIVVQSAPGQGARFTLRLPRRDEDPAAQQPAQGVAS
jgi:two-component system, OmpR family, sensor histidine kinase MtrB